MRALILAGGDLTLTLALKNLEADLVIAADGGLRHASALGLEPDLIIGDFDSATPEDLAAFAHVPRQQFPTAKAELDLELALGHALRAGATDLRVLGALGGRFDQSLAAVLIAARYARGGTRVSLHSGEQSVYALPPGQTCYNLPVNTLFSLLSLEATKLSLVGAHYDLEHAPLAFGVGLGVSNRVRTSPLQVTVHEGLCVLVVEYGE